RLGAARPPGGPDHRLRAGRPGGACGGAPDSTRRPRPRRLVRPALPSLRRPPPRGFRHRADLAEPAAVGAHGAGQGGRRQPRHLPFPPRPPRLPPRPPRRRRLPPRLVSRCPRGLATMNPTDPAPLLTTERRFLASTLAAYGSQLGRLLIRAAGDVVLARLILSGGHGVFALALGVLLIASIFRALGLPSQLIRAPRRPYGSVLLWVSGAGAALTALLALGAPLFAGLDPQLPAVLRVYSL